MGGTSDADKYFDKNSVKKDEKGNITAAGIDSYEVLTDEVKEGSTVIGKKGTLKFIYKDKNATATYYETTGWSVKTNS